MPCFFAWRVVQAASLSAVPRFPPTNARLPCSASIFPINVTVVLFPFVPVTARIGAEKSGGQLKLADDLNAPSSDVLECFHAVGHTGTNDDEIGAVERTFVLGADRHLDGIAIHRPKDRGQFHLVLSIGYRHTSSGFPE